MRDAEHPEPTGARRPSDREHRRNIIALKLAALDLMSIDQIRLCAEIIGIHHPDTDHKVLAEAMRRELPRRSARAPRFWGCSIA